MHGRRRLDQFQAHTILAPNPPRIYKHNESGEKMKNRQMEYAALIAGLLAPALTLLVFFLALPQSETIHWLSVSFILLAELVAAGGFLALRPYSDRLHGPMLRAGARILFSAYGGAALLVSLVFLTGLGKSMTLLIVLQSIIFFFAALVLTLFLLGGKYISRSEEKALAALADSESKEPGARE